MLLKVRSLLTKFPDWFTSAEMAEAARITRSQAAVCLHACLQSGSIEKANEVPARYRVRR